MLVYRPYLFFLVCALGRHPKGDPAPPLRPGAALGLARGEEGDAEVWGRMSFWHKRNSFKKNMSKTPSFQRASLVRAQVERTLDVSSLVCSAGRQRGRAGERGCARACKGVQGRARVCKGVQGFPCLETAWRPGNPHAALAARLWQGSFTALQGCVLFGEVCSNARGTLDAPGALYYQNASGGEAYIPFFFKKKQKTYVLLQV